MGANSCLDTYNLIQNLIKNVHFPKMNISTYVHKNGHNSICDRYFLWTLHHWIQHIQSYQSMLKTQFLWYIISSGPFSQSR